MYASDSVPFSLKLQGICALFSDANLAQSSISVATVMVGGASWENTKARHAFVAVGVMVEATLEMVIDAEAGDALEVSELN